MTKFQCQHKKIKIVATYDHKHSFEKNFIELKVLVSTSNSTLDVVKFQLG